VELPAPPSPPSAIHLPDDAPHGRADPPGSISINQPSPADSPGVVLPKPDYAAMEAALREACGSRGLQPTDYFLLKARTAIRGCLFSSSRVGLLLSNVAWVLCVEHGQ
jgi:hypothetical protein